MRLTLLRRGCVLARLVLAARGHGCHTVALTRENAELPEASIQALLLGAGEHRHGAVAAVGHEHAVMDDVREWQQRPLEDVYPVVFLDCLVLKSREGGTVQCRACYLALGVTVDGDRDVLGVWFEETGAPSSGLQVLTELRQGLIGLGCASAIGAGSRQGGLGRCIF